MYTGSNADTFVQNQLYMKLQPYYLLLLVFLTGIASAQNQKTWEYAGHGVQYQYIGTYTTQKSDQILNGELDQFMATSTMKSSEFKSQFSPAKYAVKLYRVLYRTCIPEMNNKPTVASGLVAIPETGKDSMPVVSYQHGTVFSKYWVPSYPDSSMETKISIARFAAQGGYIVIGADYIGRGFSDMPDSYLVSGSQEQSSLDMLYAANDVLKAQKIKAGKLFIHGWSQGGWMNMRFLRRLESVGIPVTAAATASAPVDIKLTVDRWANNYQPIDAPYLPACAAIQIFATQTYYDIPGLAAWAIKPEYLESSKLFYESKMSWETFIKKTPLKLKDFLTDEYLKSGDIATHPYWNILDKNEAYRWRCKTPLINYYGEMDEVVPVYIGTLAENTHKLLGVTSTRSESAGPKADHRATYVYAVIKMKPWFDSFLK